MAEQNQNPNSNQEADGDSQFPGLYVFSCYRNAGSRIGEYTPFANKLVAVPTDETYDARKPQLMRTNEVGKLYSLTAELGNRQLMHHLAKGKSLVVPPAELVSFAAAADGKNWRKNITESLSLLRNSEALQPLKLEKIKVEHLRKPKKLGAGASEADKTAEATYQAWYQKQKPDGILNGFVMHKTRAVIFTINKNIPINDTETIKAILPNGNVVKGGVKWLTNQFGDYRFAVLRGTEKSLPKGLYKLTFTLNKIKENEWSGAVKQKDKFGGDVFEYHLAEYIKFDISNTAGEFALVNCDPITVEEAIIKQYPRFYSHIVSAAQDYSNSHVKQDPTAKLKKATAANKTAADGNSGKVAQGALNYFSSWAVMKEGSQLAAGFATTDLENRFDAEGKQTHNGRQAIARQIGSALHKSINDANKLEPELSNAIDFAFATKEVVGAWGDFSEKVVKLARDTAHINEAGVYISNATALKKHFSLDGDHSAQALEKYAGSFAGKIHIPKVAFDLFGKGMMYADLASNVKAVGESGFKYFTKTVPELDIAKKDYLTVVKDYHAVLSNQPIPDNSELRCNFVKGEAEFTETDLEKIDEEAAKIKAKHKKYVGMRVSIIGHTCDLGEMNPNFSNIKLSYDRAEATKAALIKAGVDASIIVEVEGKGALFPIAVNDSDHNRQQNRRVEVLTSANAQGVICPSREGMDTLERCRSLTVQRQLGLEGEQLAMAGQAYDIALGLLAIMPGTQALAAGLVLAEVGSKALMSAGKFADDIVSDGIIQQYFDNLARIKTMSKESNANVGLLHELLKNYEQDTIPPDIEWAAQFRLRAEALAGLVGLMVQAAAGASKDESYETRLKKYYVAAYIKNFILGQDWLYPIKEIGMIKMDSFWIYAINSEHRSAGVSDFGLDENMVAQVAKKNIEEANTKVTLGSGHARTSYMLKKAKAMKGHLSANFHAHFPVHHLATNSIDAFANTFNPTFSNLDKSDIAYCCIYYQPDLAKDEWLKYSEAGKVYQTKSRGQMGRRMIRYPQLSPFTPVRILVVFTDAVSSVVPVSIRMIREDGLGELNGPLYKITGNVLAEHELLSHEKHHAGKVGCVFYPFYQLGELTYMGLKPMAGSAAMALMSPKIYYKLGNLNRMNYHFNCYFGENKSRKVTLPVEFDANNNVDISHARTRKEINVSVNITDDDCAQSALLVDGFLESETTTFQFPELMAGDVKARVGIKVGRKSRFIFPTRYNYAQERGEQTPNHDRILAREVFKDEAREMQSDMNGASLVFDRGRMEVKDFDWKTPVEFVFVVSCTELKKDNYEKVLMDWERLPAKVTMFEKKGGLDMAHEGPTFNMNLEYLGEVSRQSVHDTKLNFIRDKRAEGEKDDAGLIDIKLMLARNGEQACVALGWDNPEVDNSKKRYVYAARVKCSYESLKAVTVNSIRPFGEDLFNGGLFGNNKPERPADLATEPKPSEAEKAAYNKALSAYTEAAVDYRGNIQFIFKNLISASNGQSGVKIGEVNVQSEAMIGSKKAVYFSFDTPKWPGGFTENAPWTATLPDNKLEQLTVRYDNKDITKSLSSSRLSIAEVSSWLEQDAKTVKWAPTVSIKRA